MICFITWRGNCYHQLGGSMNKIFLKVWAISSQLIDLLTPGSCIPASFEQQKQLLHRICVLLEKSSVVTSFANKNLFDYLYKTVIIIHNDNKKNKNKKLHVKPLETYNSQFSLHLMCCIKINIFMFISLNWPFQTMFNTDCPNIMLVRKSALPCLTLHISLWAVWKRWGLCSQFGQYSDSELFPPLHQSGVTAVGLYTQMALSSHSNKGHLLKQV